MTTRGEVHGPALPAPGERARPLAIHALAAGPHTREAVDAFIAGHRFPIVEDASITFVYRGEA
ncbi:MAG TPA: hypothetical protein VHN14_27230, partial [Kofleriaceae bacterium]|nr:hypothetical protein [Kofleriaceae bacterium]